MTTTVVRNEMDATRERVRERYAETAKTRNGCGCSCACDSGAETLDVQSTQIGYTEDELEAIPADADLGLGCGNPTAIAGIRAGETVIDLGSGGGIDCFLAARAVGPDGRVIGIDMTDEMLDLARRNARDGGFTNVEFRKGFIEELPVENETADLVISNCVINLSPDKLRVFREIHRVLKPNGRMMVSDIVVGKELPESIRSSVAAYVGCIGGALVREEYLRAISEAGFDDPEILSDSSYGSLLAGDDESSQRVAAELGVDAETVKKWAPEVRSIKVTARRKA